VIGFCSGSGFRHRFVVCGFWVLVLGLIPSGLGFRDGWAEDNWAGTDGGQGAADGERAAMAGGMQESGRVEAFIIHLQVHVHFLFFAFFPSCSLDSSRPVFILLFASFSSIVVPVDTAWPPPACSPAFCLVILQSSDLALALVLGRMMRVWTMELVNDFPG
jgi:hypothetical protein